MPPAPAKRIRLASTSDIVNARRAAQAMLEAAGMRQIRITRFSTAISEIARNTVTHGGGGMMELAHEAFDGRRWLTATFTDSGAGIADIEQAMSDGFSTAKSLGLGLGGAKRLADAFEIESTPQGTTVKLACRLT